MCNYKPKFLKLTILCLKMLLYCYGYGNFIFNILSIQVEEKRLKRKKEVVFF